MISIRVRIFVSTFIAVALFALAGVAMGLAHNSLGYTYAGTLFVIASSMGVRSAAVIAYRNKDKGVAHLVLTIIGEILETVFFALLLWICRYLAPNLSEMTDVTKALAGNSFFMMAGFFISVLRTIALFFGKNQWLEKEVNPKNALIRAGLLLLLMTLTCVSFCILNYDAGIWANPMSFVWVVALVQALLYASYVILHKKFDRAEWLLWASEFAFIGYAVIGILM